MRRMLLIALILATAISLLAANDWLIIFHKDTEGLTKVKASPLTELDSLYYTKTDTLNPKAFSTLNLQSRFTGHETTEVASTDSIVLGTNIPLLYIDTDTFVNEISSKTEYIKASLRYIPYGDGTDTLITEVNIRGRGNSTWTYPKKPYRLKFDKKQQPGGLKKAKSFVLLANYLDKTMLKDAIGYKIAELLGMPYCNHAVPVNLVFNGSYRGAYILTEKTGINAGSVDIDETKGIMWELDTYFDEDYKFKSNTHGLPCHLKDPDFLEIAKGDSIAADSLRNVWKNDLNSVITNANDLTWENYFDKEQMVKYMLVNNIMGNHELSHPKSVKLYKDSIEGKYKMGPVWDFDWGIGFSQPVNSPLLHQISGAYSFFKPILQSETFMDAFREEFAEFKENLLPELLAYIDHIASTVRTAAYMDTNVWPSPKWGDEDISKIHFDDNIEELKHWLNIRIQCIANSETYLLFQ